MTNQMKYRRNSNKYLNSMNREEETRERRVEDMRG